MEGLTREFFMRMEYCSFKYSYWQSQINAIDEMFCAPHWSLSPENERKRHWLINQLCKAEEMSGEFYERFKRDEEVLKRRYTPTVEVQKIRELRDKVVMSIDLSTARLVDITNAVREGFFYEDFFCACAKKRGGFNEEAYNLFADCEPVIALKSCLLSERVAKIKEKDSKVYDREALGFLLKESCFYVQYMQACDKYRDGDKGKAFGVILKSEPLIMQMFERWHGKLTEETKAHK